MDEDFPLEELRLFKGCRGRRALELRAWICIFIRAYHKATRRWPATKVIASVFDMRPDHMRKKFLQGLVRDGFLSQTPPPYSSLTRYRFVKDYEYDTGFGPVGETFEEGFATE